MNACVEAVMEMAQTWPTEDQAELLDALFGLVSPAGDELEGGVRNSVCEAGRDFSTVLPAEGPSRP